MKKYFIKIFAFGALLALSSCFGQHNNAPNPGVNLESERIYGDRNAPPRQLENQYPADETGEVAERAQQIREKFFPK